MEIGGALLLVQLLEIVLSAVFSSNAHDFARDSSKVAYIRPTAGRRKEIEYGQRRSPRFAMGPRQAIQDQFPREEIV